MFCRKCGAELPDNATYKRCPACGKKLFSKGVPSGIVAFMGVLLTVTLVFSVWSIVLAVLNARTNPYIRYNYFSVEVTIPSFMGIGSLSTGEAGQENDYTLEWADATVNPDGSITKSVPYLNYDAWRKDIETKARYALADTAADDEMPYIQSIECNEDLSKILVTVDEKTFSSEMGQAGLYPGLYLAYVYRITSREPMTDDFLRVEIIDAQTGKITTTDFPKDYNLFKLFMESLQNAFTSAFSESFAESFEMPDTAA